ncbi:hypothetical protein MHBO_000428 [Bonamia ostreae]|uniref:TCTP domain-containing protein n=1 Tax=Bonamia ostreae TaxID=126728 RepID=A0ABV2AFM3_9EUKA
MKLYRDTLTNNEIITTAYKKEELRDGSIWKIESNLIDKDDDSGMKAPDLVINYSLNSINYSKKELKAIFKGYFVALKNFLQEKMKENENRESELKKFKEMFGNLKADYKKVGGFFQEEILPEFDDFEFFVTTEGLDQTAPFVIFSKYEDGKTAPSFYFIRCGLTEEKC